MRLRKQQGSLVPVLLLGLILSVVSGAGFLLSTHLAQGTSARREVILAHQLAEGASSSVRARLSEDYRNSALVRGEWLRRLLLPVSDPQSRYQANAARPDLQLYLQTSAPEVAANPGQQYNAPGLLHLQGYSPGDVYARIFPLADPMSAQVRDLEVRVSVYLPGTDQTVSHTLEGRGQEVFDFALLARTPNCQFCHLQVQGNVGALTHLRPGYEHVVADKSSQADINFDEGTGEEDPSGPVNFAGWGDGDRTGESEDAGTQMADNALASSVWGDIFAYQWITNDKSDFNPDTGQATRLNGVSLKSDSSFPNQISTRYFGPLFYLWRGSDVNGNGRLDDFPPIDRDTLTSTAQGSVEGGERLQVIPLGESYTPGKSSTLPAVVRGQAVLVGETPGPDNAYCRTATRPLVLTGEVFVQGDIVLRGCVRGRGALYSGRNLYIAGDVIYQNPPGTDGNYRTASDPDSVARTDIQAGKDSLHLAADGNILVGDYTSSDGGTLRPYRDRTGELHLRARLGLDAGVQAAVRANEGVLEELIQDAQGNTRTSSGALVDMSDVQRLVGYEALVRPAYLDPSGKLTPWMSDAQYREILQQSVPGGEDSVSTWRINASTHRISLEYPAASGQQISDTLKNLASSTDTTKLAACRAFLVENLLFNTNPTTNQAELADVERRAAAIVAMIQTGVTGWSEPGFAYLTTQSGYSGSDAIISILNRSVSVDAGGQPVYNYAVPRPTQIQRVDAFLYSPHRIAGFTNGTNLVINGGTVAAEVALSAPGVGGAQASWVGNNALKERITAKGDRVNPYNGSQYNYTQVNYDYRLRNGGSPRHIRRLNTAEFVRQSSDAPSGDTAIKKVCRNAKCN